MPSEQLLQEVEDGLGMPLTALAKRVPPTRQGRPVTLGCPLRWILDGVRSPNGNIVRLDAVRLAGRWITTPGALRRFMLAQTPTIGAESKPVARSPKRKQAAAERAGSELKRVGI